MKEFDYNRLKSCGEDVFIAADAVIKRPELVSVGSHVAIDSFCYITTAMEIGDYVHIATMVSIIGGKNGLCVVGDFAGIAAGSRIICGTDDYLGSGLTGPTVPEEYHADLIFAPVILEKYAILGTNVVVHPGVTIGEGAAVGSCSLVTRSLAPWQVYMGVPARPTRDRPREKMLALAARLREEKG